MFTLYFVTADNKLFYPDNLALDMYQHMGAYPTRCAAIDALHTLTLPHGGAYVVHDTIKDTQTIVMDSVVRR